MRARLLAVFILIILIVLPVSFYLYFTTKKIAKLIISASPWVSFSIKLIWTFWVDGLPLADKVLSYDKVCTDICTISPILPAKYMLTLTASGKTTLTDVVLINSGDEILKSYVFNDDIVLVPVWNTIKDESIPISYINHAVSQGWWEFIPIGTDIKNRVWVIKKWNESSQIGFLSMERFVSIRSIPHEIVWASIDSSLSVLIFQLNGNRMLLISIDLSHEKEISIIPNIISIVPGEIWKIQTNTGTMELKWDTFISDIRFTNSIDLSPQIRIGYIDKKDTKKLSIANLPANESVLIRLDRTTGSSVVLRRNIDIRILFFYGGKPAYVDISGNIYTIEEK